jgi:hypothetical protein
LPISITCQCGKKLKAPDKLAGKKVKCPACQHLLAVPDSPEVIEDGIDSIDDTVGGDEEVGNPRSQAINPRSFKRLSTDIGLVYFGILLRVIAVLSPLIMMVFPPALLLSFFLYPAGALLSMVGVFLSIIHTPATAPDAKLKAVCSFSFDIVSSFFFLATFIPAMSSFYGAFIQYISTCLAVLFYVLFLRNIGKIIGNRPLAGRGVVLIASISILMVLICYGTFAGGEMPLSGIVMIICFFLYQRLLFNSQKILAKL